MKESKTKQRAGMRRRLAPTTQPAKHRKAPQSTAKHRARDADWPPRPSPQSTAKHRKHRGTRRRLDPTTQPAKHRKAQQSTGHETVTGPHDPARKAPQSTAKHSKAPGMRRRLAPTTQPAKHSKAPHETATGSRDPARKAPQSTAKHPARHGDLPPRASPQSTRGSGGRAGGTRRQEGRDEKIIQAAIAQWFACWAHNPKVSESKPGGFFFAKHRKAPGMGRRLAPAPQSTGPETATGPHDPTRKAP